MIKKSKRVGEICSDYFKKYGVYITSETIRRYHKEGLINSSRDSHSFHRIFTEAEALRTERIISLLEIGVKPKLIKENNKALIRSRIQAVALIIESLKKEL